MKKPVKPTKKSIANQLYNSYNSKCNFVSTFPCTTCNGTGRIYDPNDQPDPVEGYKMCYKITCPLCQGKTTISKSTYDKITKKDINDRYAFAMKLYNENLLKYKTLQGILAYCSPKEKAFILQYIH